MSSGSLHLTQMAKIPIDFYNQDLWELLFPELEPRAGEPLCGAKAPLFFKGTSAASSLPVLNHYAHLCLSYYS